MIWPTLCIRSSLFRKVWKYGCMYKWHLPIVQSGLCGCWNVLNSLIVVGKMDVQIQKLCASILAVINSLSDLIVRIAACLPCLVSAGPERSLILAILFNWRLFRWWDEKWPISESNLLSSFDLLDLLNIISDVIIQSLSPHSLFRACLVYYPVRFCSGG